jgi:hypothetical protein
MTLPTIWGATLTGVSNLQYTLTSSNGQAFKQDYAINGGGIVSSLNALPNPSDRITITVPNSILGGYSGGVVWSLLQNNAESIGIASGISGLATLPFTWATLGQLNFTYAGVNYSCDNVALALYQHQFYNSWLVISNTNKFNNGDYYVLGGSGGIADLKCISLNDGAKAYFQISEHSDSTFNIEPRINYIAQISGVQLVRYNITSYASDPFGPINSLVVESLLAVYAPDDLQPQQNGITWRLLANYVTALGYFAYIPAEIQNSPFSWMVVGELRFRYLNQEYTCSSLGIAYSPSGWIIFSNSSQSQRYYFVWAGNSSYATNSVVLSCTNPATNAAAYFKLSTPTLISNSFAMALESVSV